MHTRSILYFMLSLVIFSLSRTVGMAFRPEPGITITGAGFPVEAGKKAGFSMDRNHNLRLSPDSGGRFMVNLDALEVRHMIWFAYGKTFTPIYAEPGDSIHIEYDLSGNAFRFSGAWKDRNNYLFSRSVIDRSVDEEKLFNLPTDSFELALTELIARYTDNLTHYPGHLDEWFVSVEGKFNSFLHKNKMQRYYAFRQRTEAAEKLEADLSKMYNETDLLLYPAFRGVLYNDYRVHVDQEAMQRAEKEGGRDYFAYIGFLFKGINERYTQPPVRDYLYYHAMYRYVKNSSDKLEKVFQQFNERCTHSGYRAYIGKLVDEKMSSLSAGMPAPDFRYPNVKGDSVSLKDFLGKAVYVDLWATWCSPCIQEFPHFERLRQAFGGEGKVAFVYLSIDTNEKSWRAFLEKNPTGAVHLLAKEGREAVICKEYMVGGIPRYLLIDKKGNILDANAPSPSSKKIETLLQSLVE